MSSVTRFGGKYFGWCISLLVTKYHGVAQCEVVDGKLSLQKLFAFLGFQWMILHL